MTATRTQRSKYCAIALTRVALVLAAALASVAVAPLARAAAPAGAPALATSATAGDEGGIYARRYHADGTPYGSEVLVSPTAGVVNQAPTFAILAAFYVVHSDGASHETLPFVVPCSGVKAGPGSEAAQKIVSVKVVSYTHPELFTTGPALAGCDKPLTATATPGVHGQSIVTVAVTDDGGTEGGGEDTSTLTLTLTVVEVPTGRSETASGKENSGCIPISLLGTLDPTGDSSVSNPLPPDPRFPGLATDYPPMGFFIDGDSFSTATGNGTLSYENNDGVQVQILPGHTYFLSSIEKTVCLVPAPDEHSVRDTATGQLEPYATFQYRFRDNTGATTGAYTVSFIVEPVF